MVTASADKTARVWRLSDTGVQGEAILLQGHTGLVYHAAFSRDGTRVVTASADETARVWRLSDTGVQGEAILLQGHTGTVRHAAFSRDGTRVVTASGDETARVWRIGWNELLTYLRNRTTACLTVKQRIRYLAEDSKESQERYEACERKYGRVP